MTPSISEIIQKTSELKSATEKVAFLQKNSNFALKTILKGTYDKSVKFLLPSTPPPWKKNGYTGVEGMLHKEARRLRIFVEGGGYDNLKQTKREELFIKLLEDIDDKDADILAHMITKKSFKGITPGIVRNAFPGLIEETADNKGTNDDG